MKSTRRGKSSSNGRMWTVEGVSFVWTLEPTDVILSSLNAKKVVYFVPEFRLWAEFPEKVEVFCGNRPKLII